MNHLTSTDPKTRELMRTEQTNARFIQSLLVFFFQPSSAHTLAIIRCATGLMLAYVHCIWLLGSTDFFGPDAIISNELWRSLHESPSGNDFKWTYLSQTNSLLTAQIHEGIAIVSALGVAAGLFTRTSLIIAWFTTLMTTHRLTGYLFGLDQVVLMLSFYLMFAQSGRVASLDQWLAIKLFSAKASKPDAGTKKAIKLFRTLSGWHGNTADPNALSWKNRAATRMMQIHVCIVYLFGGLGKLRGEMWWDGTAMWYSAAAYDYQSMDLTWIGYFPVLGALLSHMTVFWEVSYGAIVWPRWLRPWTLLTAVMVHGGIAIFMGMITFGMMMIFANIAFVSPELTRRIFQVFLRSPSPASSGTSLRSARDHR